MIVFKKSTQLTAYIIRLKATGNKIGFVPTMGALHKGHLSLFEKSLLDNNITVCSIFINPTQFNNANDFRKYPVTLEKDEIYPNGITHLQHFNLGTLEHTLEGTFRPNHFQGVSQVMFSLLNIIQPHNLYMGQKDYQQCMVVQRLLNSMNSDTLLNRCPTQREESGLAMSSRNMRLNEEQKKMAVTISAVLKFFKHNLKSGDLMPMIKKGKEMLELNQFKIDYVEITDVQTLESVAHWNGTQKLVGMIAAFINDIRLIDNMILTD